MSPAFQQLISLRVVLKIQFREIRSRFPLAGEKFQALTVSDHKDDFDFHGWARDSRLKKPKLQCTWLISNRPWARRCSGTAEKQFQMPQRTEGLLACKRGKSGSPCLSVETDYSLRGRTGIRTKPKLTRLPEAKMQVFTRSK